jgi:hypothetical protein
MPNLLKSLPREILEKEDSKFIYNVLNPLLFDKVKESDGDITVIHKVDTLLNKDINLKGQFTPSFTLPYNINSREFNVYMTDGQENNKVEYFGKTELINDLDDLKDFIFFYFGVDGYGFLKDIVKKYYYILNEYEKNKKLYEYNYKKYQESVDIKKKKVYKSTYEHFKSLYDKFDDLKVEFDILILVSGGYNDYSIDQILDNYAREIGNHLDIRTFDNNIVFEQSILFEYLTTTVQYDDSIDKHIFVGKEILSSINYEPQNIFELMAIFAMEIYTLKDKYDQYLKLLLDNGNGYALDRSEQRKLKNKVYSDISVNLNSDNLTYFLNEETNELEVYLYFLKDFRIDESTINLTINDREIAASIYSLTGRANYGYTIFEYFDDETKYYKFTIHDYLIYDLDDEYINYDIDSINIKFDAVKAIYHQPHSSKELYLESNGFLDNFVIYKKNETTGFFENINVPFKVRVSIDEKEERYARSYEMIGINDSAHLELISQPDIVLGCYDYDYVYEPKLYVDFFKYGDSEVNFRFNTILPYVLIDDVMDEEFELSYYAEIPRETYSTNIHKNITMYDGKTYRKLYDEINHMKLLNPYNESNYEMVSKISYESYKERNHTNPALVQDTVGKIPFKDNLNHLEKIQYDKKRDMLIFMFRDIQCVVPLNEGLNRNLNYENLDYNVTTGRHVYHGSECACNDGFKYTEDGIYLKNPITQEYDLIEAIPSEQINLSVRSNEIFFDMFEMAHCVILNDKKYKITGLFVDTYMNALNKDTSIMFVESKYGIPRYKTLDGNIVDVDFSKPIIETETPMDGYIIFDEENKELTYRYTETESYTLSLVELEVKIPKHRQLGMTAFSIFYAGNVLPENSNKTFFGRENIFNSMQMPDDIYKIGRSGDIFNNTQQHGLLAEQLDLNAQDAEKYNMEEESYLMFKSATASFKGLESYLRSNLKSVSQDIGVSPVYLVQRNRFISEWARVSTVMPESSFAESALKDLVADLMETKLLNQSYDDLIDIFKNNEYEKFSIDTNNIHSILVQYILRFLKDEFLLEDLTYYLIHDVWIANNRKKILDFIKTNADDQTVREVSAMSFTTNYEKEQLFYIFVEELGKVNKQTIESYIPLGNYSDWELYEDNNHVKFEKPYHYDVVDISDYITMPVEWKHPLYLIRPLNDDGVFTKRDYRFLDMSMATNTQITYDDSYNEYVEDIKNKLNRSVNYLEETLKTLNELSITQGFDVMGVNLVIVKWIVERHLPTYVMSNNVEDIETFKDIIRDELSVAEHPNLIVSYNKIKETTMLGNLGDNISEIYESIELGNMLNNSSIRLNITSNTELEFLDKIKKPLEHYFDYLFFAKRHDIVTKVLALFTEDVIATSMLDLSFAINIKNTKGDETFDIYEQMVHEIFDEFLPFHSVLDKIIFTIKIMESSSGEAVDKQLDTSLIDTAMIDIYLDFMEKIRIQTFDSTTMTTVARKLMIIKVLSGDPSGISLYSEGSLHLVHNDVEPSSGGSTGGGSTGGGSTGGGSTGGGSTGGGSTGGGSTGGGSTGGGSTDASEEDIVTHFADIDIIIDEVYTDPAEFTQVFINYTGQGTSSIGPMVSIVQAFYPSEGLKFCGGHDEIPYDYDRKVKVGGHDLTMHDDEFENYGVDDEWYVINREAWRHRANDIEIPPEYADFYWECIPDNEFEKVAETNITDYYSIKTNIFERDDKIESFFVDSVPIIDITQGVSENPDIDVTEDYLIAIDSTYKIKFYDMENIPHDEFGLDETSGPEDQTALIGMQDAMRQHILQDFYDKINISVMDSIWSDIVVVYDLIDIPGHDEFGIDENYHQRPPERLDQELSAMAYDGLVGTDIVFNTVEMADVSLVDKTTVLAVTHDFRELLLNTVVSDEFHVTVDIVTNRPFDSEGRFLKPGHDEFVYDEYYHDSTDPKRADNMADIIMGDFMGDIRIDFGFMRMLSDDPYDEMIKRKFYRADLPGSEFESTKIKDTLISDIRTFSKDIIRVGLMDFYTLDMISNDVRRKVYEDIENESFGGEWFTSSIADSLIKRHIHHDFRENIIAIDKYASILNDSDILEIYGAKAANFERDELFKLEIGDEVYSTIKIKQDVDRATTKFDRDYLKSIKIEEENFIEFKYMDKDINVRFKDSMLSFWKFSDRATIVLNVTEKTFIEQFDKEEIVALELLDNVHYGRMHEFDVDGMTLYTSDKLIESWSNKIHTDSLITTVTEIGDLTTSVDFEYEFGEERVTQPHAEFGHMGYTDESVERTIESKMNDSLIQLSEETHFDSTSAKLYDGMLHDVGHYFGEYIDVAISESLHSYIEIVKKPWVSPLNDDSGHDELPHMFHGESEEFDITTELKEIMKMDAYTQLYNADTLVELSEKMDIGYHYEQEKGEISVSLKDDLKVLEIIYEFGESIELNTMDYTFSGKQLHDVKAVVSFRDTVWYGYKLRDEELKVHTSDLVYFSYEDEDDQALMSNINVGFRDWLFFNYIFIDDKPNIVITDRLKYVDFGTESKDGTDSKDYCSVALKESLNIHEHKFTEFLPDTLHTQINDMLVVGEEEQEFENIIATEIILKDTMRVVAEESLGYGPGKILREHAIIHPSSQIYSKIQYNDELIKAMIDADDSFHEYTTIAPFKDNVGISTYERMKFGPIFRDKLNIITDEKLDVKFSWLDERYGVDMIHHTVTGMEYYNGSDERQLTALAQDDIKVLDMHLTFGESLTILSTDQLLSEDKTNVFKIDVQSDGIVVVGNDNLMYGIGMYDYIWDAKEWDLHGDKVPYESWSGHIPHDDFPYDELEHSDQGEDLSHINTGVTDNLFYGFDFIFKDTMSIQLSDEQGFETWEYQSVFKDRAKAFIDNRLSTFQGDLHKPDTTVSLRNEIMKVSYEFDDNIKSHRFSEYNPEVSVEEINIYDKETYQIIESIMKYRIYEKIDAEVNGNLLTSTLFKFDDELSLVTDFETKIDLYKAREDGTLARSMTVIKDKSHAKVELVFNEGIMTVVKDKLHATEAARPNEYR